MILFIKILLIPQDRMNKHGVGIVRQILNLLRFFQPIGLISESRLMEFLR